MLVKANGHNNPLIYSRNTKRTYLLITYRSEAFSELIYILTCLLTCVLACLPPDSPKRGCFWENGYHGADISWLKIGKYAVFAYICLNSPE